ncbi:MAG: IclR family transcriptional regulator [Anaerolineae bacterium]|nr:IclR family transcriptional regulator [Anaerolineae bacterium]
MPKQDDDAYYLLSTVVRAVSVLDEFVNSDQDLGVTEVARRLGLHKSVVHRLIATLAELRLLAPGMAPGTYRLGVKALELGLSYLRHSPLDRVAQHHLNRLAGDLPDMAFHVAILDGKQIIYQRSVSGPEVDWVSATLGRRTQAYCTALGKVLLAYQSPSTVDAYLTSVDLKPLTHNTITGSEDLRAELNRIRMHGYSHDNEEMMIGHTCVGAPIRDHTGFVIAAVSIAGLTDHFTKYGFDSLVEKVGETAKAISYDLGYSG